MFYKPNYCCHCGDKIERVEWHLWTNRRFCPLCETEYLMDDWLKRIFPIIFCVIGLFGIGAYLQGAEKTLDIAQNGKSASEPNKSLEQNSQLQALQSSNVQKNDRQIETEEKGQVEDKEQKTVSEEADQQTVGRTRSPQKSAAEAVYFCGAETKKGTPCSRRVRGGGRCWQHKGREAILPPKDLLIEQN